MKKPLLVFLAACSLCACKNTGEKVDYTYKEVPFTDVHFTDNFWAPRIETLRNVTVPFAFRKCEETNRIDNFAVAAGLKDGKFNSPYPFDDSDVYKIMEGASVVPIGEYMLKMPKNLLPVNVLKWSCTTNTRNSTVMCSTSGRKSK